MIGLQQAKLIELVEEGGKLLAKYKTGKPVKIIVFQNSKMSAQMYINIFSLEKEIWHTSMFNRISQLENSSIDQQLKL